MAWNEYLDVFTFISSQFLVFTRNEQMRCLETFRGNANGGKHTRSVTSHVDNPRNFSGENMTRLGKVKKKNVPKTAKIEVYNTRFQTFPCPKLQTPLDAT